MYRGDIKFHKGCAARLAGLLTMYLSQLTAFAKEQWHRTKQLVHQHDAQMMVTECDANMSCNQPVL